MALLFLVRHGQASFGQAHYDQLSDQGRQQARWLGEYFAGRGLKFKRPGNAGEWAHGHDKN